MMSHFRLSSILLLGLFLAMLLLGGAGSGADEVVYLYLYNAPALAAPSHLATALGGWEVLIPAAIIGALALAFTGRRRDALLLIAIVAGGRFLVWLMKEIAARPRPALEDHLVAIGSASFPSGHAANGLITWLALALLLPPMRRALPIVAALALSAAIGLSRVVLGVHWPSDVIAGWAFGLIWTLGLIALARDKARPC